MNEIAKDIAKFAIEVWRCKKRLIAAPELKEASGLLDLSFDRIDKLIESYGLLIVDHLGKEYNDGMVEEVIYSENDESIAVGRRIVTETLKPTVYLDDKIEVCGQIIVSENKAL